uniref:Uncharacterized protein n=1 Tax=Romanomermis culicivorax TaxID=13658 RepID=A0A915KKW5_ROMCU
NVAHSLAAQKKKKIDIYKCILVVVPDYFHLYPQRKHSKTKMSLPMLDECTLDLLYDWLDGVPFSKPRKNIARDFSDGGKRVFNKLNFQVSPNSIHQVVQCKPGAIELVLMNLRPKIESALANGRLLKPPSSGRFRSRSVSRNGSSLSLASTAGSLSSSSCSRQRSRQDIIDDMMYTYIQESETLPVPLNSANDGETAISSLKDKLKEKEEECKNLRLRCTHYETLMETKDEKIRQLTSRLDRLAQAVCSQTVNFNDLSSQKPKFSFR